GRPRLHTGRASQGEHPVRLEKPWCAPRARAALAEEEPGRSPSRRLVREGVLYLCRHDSRAPAIVQPQPTSHQGTSGPVSHACDPRGSCLTPTDKARSTTPDGVPWGRYTKELASYSTPPLS